MKLEPDGILRRENGQYKQLALPKKYRRLVYKELHEEMGHLGADRTVHLARQRFHWHWMQSDIEYFIGNRCQCNKQRHPAFHTRDPLKPIATTAPFEMVLINSLHLEKSSGGYEYILVIVYHFTCYCQAYATRNKSARTAAEKLYNESIPRLGFPLKIHHDQGAEFENKLFHHLEELCDVTHSRTTPYHPEGNGQVECFNRTLLSMLRTLPEPYKSHWKDHLNKVIHAYNFTQHESTGHSPFYLTFGCRPCLPIDLVSNLKPPVENKPYPKYVADWQSAMKEAYNIAASKCKVQGDKAKAFYDLKVQSSTLLPGDRVLIKNLSERGRPGKLRPYWEDKVHVIIHRKSPDSPVYQLKPENGTGPIRTLHRNLLFPCGTLLESPSTPRKASPGRQELKPSTALSKRKSERSSKSTHSTRPSPESTEQSDDDEDSDFALVYENVPQSTSSSVLSPFAPAFKNVPEPPEEPTTENAALIENPSQEMLEIPPHSPIPDLPSNNFGNSAFADGGPVDTPAPAADATESLQDQ